MSKIVFRSVWLAVLTMLVAIVAMAAPMKVEHQIDILAQTERDDNGWFVTPEQDSQWEKWHYAVTDLDHDGNLEILKAKEAGLDGAPYIQCEELIEKKWERRWGIYLVGGSDYPDIFSDPEAAAHPLMYENPEVGLCFYIFDSVKWRTEFENTTKKYAVYLNGDLMVEELAFKTWQLSGFDGTVTEHYYLPGWLKIEAESNVAEPPPEEIDKARFENICQERLGPGKVWKPTIGWMDTKRLWAFIQRGKSFNMLWDSYKLFKDSTW